jgi:predicted small lipoprotein YifL
MAVRTARRRFLLALLVVAGATAGCGQKGPLYFPEQEPERERRRRRSADAGRPANASHG